MKGKIICLIIMICILTLAIKIENDMKKQRINESIISDKNVQVR